MLSYPFITLQPENTYSSIVSEESSNSQFVVRLQQNFQSFSVQLGSDSHGKVNTVHFGEEAIGLPNWMKGNVAEMLRTAFTVEGGIFLYFSHNLRSTGLQSALKRLLEHSDPEAPSLINYLLLLNGFGSAISLDILDIVKFGSTNMLKEQNPVDRFEAIKRVVQSEKALVYLSESANEEGAAIFVQEPIYRISTLHHLPMMLEELDDISETLYYRLEIFGERRSYVVYHPFLERIYALTGIDLRSRAMLRREYETVSASLRTL